MARLSVVPVALALVLISPSRSYAQVKDAFASAVVKAAVAADGTFGDEGPALLEAIEEMAAGLVRWDAAIARAEAGLASDIGKASPAQAARMRGALGTIYLERGRLDDAIAQLTRAVALDAGAADLQVLRGVALNVRGSGPDANLPFRLAWERERSNPANAYLFLSSGADLSERDARVALETLLDAVQRQVSSGSASRPPHFFTVGLLDDASVTEPSLSPALYAETFFEVANAGYEEAIARVRAAVAVDPLVTDRALQSPGVRAAIDLVRKENAAAAIGPLSSAVEQSPGSSELRRVLGVAYWADQQYEKSLEQLRAAVRLNPANERARLAISDVLAASGDLAGAREAAASALQAIPESLRARWKLGLLHRALGDNPNALQAWAGIVERPQYAGFGSLLTALAGVQYAQADTSMVAAIQLLRARINPNQAAAHSDLGEAYLAQDQLLEALCEFLISALLDPADPKPFAAIGQVLMTMERSDEAVPLLKKAIALDPGRLDAHYALSRALLRLGLKGEAQEVLAAFARLQSKAMEDERRRFQENREVIERTLKETAAPGAAR